MHKLLTLLLLFLTGCARIPQHLQPVGNFDVDRYLGTWYEIARLDHSFERGLSHVSAEYSWREDGGVRVLNRGFAAKTGAWQEAEGKAYFLGPPDQGALKVSFFGPFYGAYVILALDPGYQHALVCGPNRSYLWILARTPDLPTDIRQRLINQAAAAGFDTGQLLFISHDQSALPQASGIERK